MCPVYVNKCKQPPLSTHWPVHPILPSQPVCISRVQGEIFSPIPNIGSKKKKLFLPRPDRSYSNPLSDLLLLLCTKTLTRGYFHSSLFWRHRVHRDTYSPDRHRHECLRYSLALVPLFFSACQYTNDGPSPSLHSTLHHSHAISNGRISLGSFPDKDKKRGANWWQTINIPVL